MRIRSAFVFALVLFAASAHAAVFNLDPVENPLGDCSTAATADQCMSVNWGTTANISTCTSSECVVCGKDALHNDRPVCARITMSASCKCELTANGPIVSNCTETGQCTFVH